MNPQRFPDSRLIERNPKLDCDSLHRANAFFAGRISTWACAWGVVTIEAFPDWIVIDGDQRVTVEREEVLGGRYVHIKFRCGGCNRGCRVLSHTRAQGWLCRSCAHYDYQSRHRNRWAPSAGRLASLRRRLELGHPLHRWSKRKLRRAMLAHEENIADSVHNFVERLKASYGQHEQQRSSAADAASQRRRPSPGVPRR